ncbi:MAG: AAA family ATPase [Agitococcus sp.]|nr:AAA family ATPase [Agitococcus sp.]
MIDSITIENFRCFDKTTVKGFGLINLIGGKNNSGKTVLLEAVLLNQSPTNDVIELVQNLRGEDDKTRSALGDKAWDSLFYMQENNKQIKITSITQDTNHEVLIYCDKNYTEFSELIDEKTVNDPKIIEFKNKAVISNNIVLHIDGKSSTMGETSSLIILNDGGKFRKNNYSINSKPLGFVASNVRIDQSDIARDFDIAYENGFFTQIINGLNIIDSSIKDARTSTSAGKARIILARENEKFMPLSLFGDAITKILDITLTIITAKDSLVLIDEIENGIHHSSQQTFWRHLIKLARAFNVQVFATTHSEEMIKALNTVALGSEYESDVMYFEMAKHAKTNKIKGIATDMRTLQSKLYSNTPYRGE